MLWKLSWACHCSWLLKISHQYKPGEKTWKTQPEVASQRTLDICEQVNSSEKVSRGVGLMEALLNVSGRHGLDEVCAAWEKAPRSAAECATPALLPNKALSLWCRDLLHAENTPLVGNITHKQALKLRNGVLCTHPRLYLCTEPLWGNTVKCWIAFVFMAERLPSFSMPRKLRRY